MKSPRLCWIHRSRFLFSFVVFVGGHTPIRSNTGPVNSDVEDGELSEEDNEQPSRSTSNRRDHKSLHKSDVGNRHTDDEEEGDESKDDDHEPESR